MLLRHYEIPDGRSDGQPEVLVADKVTSILGMPSVNYDGLHKYLTDELGIPYESPTRIKLYCNNRYNNTETRGYRVPYTDTFHVNAVTAEALFPTTGGVMRVIAYEGRRRADSETHRILSTTSAFGVILASTLPFEIASRVSFLPKTFLFGLAGAGAVTSKLKYEKYFSPVGRRAMRQQQDPSTMEHEGDIIFPNSPRTSIYLARIAGMNFEPSNSEKYHKR